MCTPKCLFNLQSGTVQSSTCRAYHVVWAHCGTGYSMLGTGASLHTLLHQALHARLLTGRWPPVWIPELADRAWHMLIKNMTSRTSASACLNAHVHAYAHAHTHAHENMQLCMHLPWGLLVLIQFEELYMLRAFSECRSSQVRVPNIYACTCPIMHRHMSSAC